MNVREHITKCIKQGAAYMGSIYFNALKLKSENTMLGGFEQRYRIILR